MNIIPTLEVRKPRLRLSALSKFTQLGRSEQGSLSEQQTNSTLKRSMKTFFKEPWTGPREPTMNREAPSRLWAEFCPPKKTCAILTPSISDVTLFGNGVDADVIGEDEVTLE